MIIYVKNITDVLQAHKGENEPKVAFLCNRPSMYLTDRGWIKDDDTGCLRDPVDILNYCHKVSERNYVDVAFAVLCRFFVYWIVTLSCLCVLVQCSEAVTAWWCGYLCVF